MARPSGAQQSSSLSESTEKAEIQVGWRLPANRNAAPSRKGQMTTFEYRGHQVAISEPFDMGWRRIYIDKEDMGCHGKEAESTARQLVDVMKQMGFEYKGHQVSVGRYIVDDRYDGWFASHFSVLTNDCQ